jgi:TPR repeat protein
MKNNLKILVLTGLLASTSAFAKDVATNQNLETSRMVFTQEIWEKNQENPLAQFYIAEQHYLQGDKELALKWYLRSALNKNESAINNALLMIESGEGTKNNLDNVVSFMEKIALKGDLFSQLYLGNIYRTEQYHQNYEKSFFWYSEAAKQGDDRAQYFVGNMSINGVGTFQNIPKGIRHLESIAEKGHVGAMFTMGKLNKLGYNIAKNHKEASKWFDMAAKEGNVESMYEIADSLENGYGIQKDTKKALEWFETSALHGDTQSAYRAGLLNLDLSVSGDDEYTVDKAVEWLTLAADESLIQSQLRMGDLYYEGKFGVDKNYKKAESWYKLAASQGDKLAYKKLSLIYRIGGYGVDRNNDAYKEAIKKYYTNDNKRRVAMKHKDKLSLFNNNIFNY